MLKKSLKLESKLSGKKSLRVQISLAVAANAAFSRVRSKFSIAMT